jgi:hypothetical protein
MLTENERLNQLAHAASRLNSVAIGCDYTAHTNEKRLASLQAA